MESHEEYLYCHSPKQILLFLAARIGIWTIKLKGTLFTVYRFCVCVQCLQIAQSTYRIPTSKRRCKQWKTLFEFRVAWVSCRNSLNEGKNNFQGASAKACTETGITSSEGRQGRTSSLGSHSIDKRAGGCIRRDLPQLVLQC